MEEKSSTTTSNNGYSENIDGTITMVDQLKSLTERQRKVWVVVDKKAQVFMKGIDPVVARQHTQRLVEKGVKIN